MRGTLIGNRVYLVISLLSLLLILLFFFLSYNVFLLNTLVSLSFFISLSLTLSSRLGCSRARSVFSPRKLQ
jgi:hypothetical protein